MRRLIALLMSIVVTFASLADAPELIGEVVDSYSRELLMGAQVDVLRPDSTLIGTYWADTDLYFRNHPANLRVDSVPRTGCLLYVSHEGFYPVYVNVPKLGSREYVVTIPPIRLNRVPFYKPRELNEVTVTASRVKMVVKGDTITYNADAFALAQGSMLDGLIDQLPGAELKSDGRIFINGKFVSDLLVNGDSFFKGDPKIALENLPAYMVKDIKVFHRNDLLANKPIDEQPLVMDVRLKKQYQTGWIANAEVGYGTANRYEGRVFGMLFTRDSRLTLVGNINNTNDDRKPGQTDNWNPNWQTAGRARIIVGGLDYMRNSRLRDWKIEANLMAKHKKSLIETSSNTKRYLTGGNLIGQSASSAESRQFSISSDNKIQWFLTRSKLYLIPKFSFERTKSNETEQSTSATADGTLLNSLDETGLVYDKEWRIGSSFGGYWQLPMQPEEINFSASIDWNKKNSESSRLRNLFFPEQSDASELTSPQEFLPEKKLRADVNLSYKYSEYKPTSLIEAGISAEYTFNYSRDHSTRDYYLRQLEDDVLPSEVEATQNAGFIPSNSYDYISTESRHKLKLGLGNFFPPLHEDRYQPNFSVDVILNYAPGHIDYLQNDRTYSARRNPFYADAKFWFEIGDLGWVNYRYNSTLPSLRNLLDITDAANPLYIYRGNSSLKMTRIHEINFQLYHIYPKGPLFEAVYKKYQNMIAQSADYDMTSGITTYKPVNIDGNWDVTAKLSSPSSWSRFEKWQPEGNIRAMYQNSVDIIGLENSIVRNFNLSGKVKLLYRIIDGLEVSATANAEWRKVTSPMVGFDPFSAVDFDYGVVLRAVKLPWNISFTTDLMMHSRRGYADSRLNTNDLVWNARVAKSILHGNLTFAIDGFDILGQLSNVRLTINSQGRIETRYNTLPRYAMFHAIYRLNIQPKGH
jgi:hypothetical protein